MRKLCAAQRAPFQAIEAVSLPWLDRIHAWCFRWIFRNNYFSQALTAFNYFFHLAFEWRAWQQTRARILAGDFDVVLRLLPVSAVLPSPFAFFLRRGPIPFVIGPINGGLPWPPGFSQANKQKEWISSLRRSTGFCLSPDRLIVMRRPSLPAPPKPTPSLQHIAKNCFCSRGERH